MKILLTGSTGQVGYELRHSLQKFGDVVQMDRAEMDLSDLAQVRQVVQTVRPQLIVNPAAYTAVDLAESQPELARTVNALAPAVMAEEARKLGAAMIQFSTDYVFDGNKPGAYIETDRPNPLSVYGRTKLEGEEAVAAAGIHHLILRTSWVYGMRGKNFMLTMLRLARERGELRVVNDQHGAPTWSNTIASTTSKLIAMSAEPGWWDRSSGIYHLTNRGTTTWFGFAQAILDNMELACRLTPITSKEYPQAAVRPANSSLDCTKLGRHLPEPPEWRAALASCMGPSLQV